MTFLVVTLEERTKLACASGPTRTPAEALVLARIADEQGMPSSAAAWREVAELTVPTPRVSEE